MKSTAVEDAGGSTAAPAAQPAGEGSADPQPSDDTASLPSSPPSGAPAPASPGGANSKGLRFLSYRDEIRGYSDSGDPPRRMRHWLLLDGQGREHVAVDTTLWEPTKKRFTYEAVAPFSEVKPLKCRSQRDVLTYLDQFVPPEARSVGSLATAVLQGGPKAEEMPAKAEAMPAKAPRSGTAGTGGPSPRSEKRKGDPAGSAAKQAKKVRDGSAAGTALVQASDKYIADNTRRRMVQELRVSAVSHELSLLRAECGFHYSLTLVAPDCHVSVLTSGTATAVATSPVTGLLPLPGPAAAHKVEDGAGTSAPCGNGIISVDGDEGKAVAAAVGSEDAARLRARRDRDRKRKQRRSSGGGGGEGGTKQAESTRKPPEDSDVAAVVARMDSNDRSYLNGSWRVEPFPTHPLEPITAFQVAEDCGEALEQSVLLAKLATNLAPPPGSPGNRPPRDDEDLLLLHHLPAPVAAADLALQSVWGLDSYTRANLTTSLERCPELVAGLDPEAAAAARDAFVQGWLLPALNSLGDDGWDVVKALEVVAKKAAQEGRQGVRAAAEAVAQIVEGVEQHFNGGAPCVPCDRQWFRAHPKGEGLVVKRRGGLPAGEFVGQYLGELYCAWRWAEREGQKGKGGGARRPAVLRMGASSEFFNIGMVRPRADVRGYDALYVDAVGRGNVVSRLSHNCDPNCRTVTVAAGGRLTIGVWSTRAVAAGEELTIDFAGETEIEREYQGAVCLCGSAACRGTFLYLTPGTGSPLYRIFSSRHSFLDRCRLLLHAAAEPHLAFEDNERLSRHGFKELIMHDGLPGAGGAQVPRWLRKWAALVLEFIEEEEATLPALLGGAADEAAGFGPEEVAEEVAHQVAARVHSLAVALDRAKLVLRHQGEELAVEPPLRTLSDAEAAAFLWSGDESVARRAALALGSYVEQQAADTMVAKRAPRRGDRKAAPWWQVPAAAGGGDTGGGGGLVEAVDVKSGGGGEASERQQADEGTGDMDDGGKDSGAAAAAAAAAGEEVDGNDPLHALVEQVEALLERRAVSSAKQARQGLLELAALLRAAGPAHAGLHDLVCTYAATRCFAAQTEYEPFTSQLCNGDEGPRYRSAFLWALLCSWHRVGGPDPLDFLLKERRGCVCLPDPESTYMPSFSSGKYSSAAGGERVALLKHLATAPRCAWPAGSSFTFRNAPRVFGSPQMDAVLQPEAGPAVLAALVHELQAVQF